MKTLFFSVLAALFLQLFPQTSFGQLNPGFMGKKLFAEVGTSIGFTSRADESNGSGFYQPPTLFAPRLDVDIYYTIGRSVVARLGWSHLYFNVGTTHNIAPLKGSFFEELHGSIYAVYVNDVHIGLEFCLNKRKGYIAPLGSYIGLGLRHAMTNRVLTNGTPGITRYAVTTAQNPFSMTGIDLSYRYRTVIANRFVLSFGIGSTLFSYLINPFFKEEFIVDDFRDRNNYKTLVSRSINTRYLITANISFGVFLTR